MRNFLFGLLFVFFVVERAHAYPEMVRHGYVNCTTCHVSPSGGGVLTSYGRELSKEVLSTWGREGEGSFAYFAKDPPEWLNLGGDFRTVYLYRNNPAFREGRYILMQADLEAFVKIAEHWYIGGTGGIERARKNGDYEIRPKARRHWINYRPTDELSFRAGKFNPAYGINLPDHIVVTKRGLGWDQDHESYNVEAAWLGENWNYYLTGVFGRPDDSALQREKGIAASAAYAFLERYKVGLSYFYGSRNEQKRQVVGPFGILGFTPRFFLLTETDFQFAQATAKTQSTTGLVSYQQLNYEIIQGFHAFLTWQLSYLDFKNGSNRYNSHGLGLQWFPRPHFDVLATWQKEKNNSQYSGVYTDLAWLQMHFYF